MEHIAYEYKNCPVPGGGYATGFLFHPAKKGLLYLRTDIGGTYRFDAAVQQWVFLSPHVTHLDCAQAFPIALAVDANRPQRLYILGGEYGKPCGELAISDDYGDTFTAKPVSFFVHGNLNGRGTGERLIVDAADPATLWCASQRDGLWVTRDLGDTWAHVSGLTETHLTFVAQVNGKLIVGAAGVSAKHEDMRGPALYVGDGVNFTPMQQPENVRMEGCRIHGLAAQRWSADDRYLYVTFAGSGPHSYVDDLGYSCDSGDATDGHIVRYPLTENGFGPMEDITPCTASPAKGVGLDGIRPGDHAAWGYSRGSAPAAVRRDC